MDLKTTGIIAPTKVIRRALENAVSVAGERLTMKRSTKAALVSLFLPGAGLWYYGRPRLGLINFLIALICPIVGFYAGLIGEHILWMFLAIAAGSAGFSHAMASEPVSPE